MAQGTAFSKMIAARLHSTRVTKPFPRTDHRFFLSMVAISAMPPITSTRQILTTRAIAVLLKGRTNLITTLGFKRHEIDRQFPNVKSLMHSLINITQEEAGIGMLGFCPPTRDTMMVSLSWWTRPSCLPISTSYSMSGYPEALHDGVKQGPAGRSV